MDYVIADHIYTCATDAGVVVLNSRSGKYSMVPGDRARTLEGVVHGWPVLPLETACVANQTAPSSLLNSLIHSGMVRPVADSGLEVYQRVMKATAQEALLDALTAREKPKIHARDVATFMVSVTYAKAMLKFRPFEALISDLRRRKNYRTTRAGIQPLAHIRELVKVFAWLRPFAYAESDACLLDSLALTHFLFRRHVLADFFIGVRIRPFVAHSWVQAQGFALNGLPEYLAAYTPILSV